MFINNIAGMRVRLVSGIIDQIVSPRVFILKSERDARFSRRPDEVAIVVDSGSASVRQGAPVVVTGIARTLLGVEMDNRRPIPLTESERQTVAKLPLVVSSSIQTPDGVQLVRRTP
jgi:hypothetical protein